MRAAAAAVFAAAPIALDAQIISAGGDITVTSTGAEAGLRSELWFFGTANPGPDQTPFDTYSGLFLFANQGAQTSAAPGSGGVAALGSPTANLNPGGMFASGVALNFGIWVQDLYMAGAENPNAPGSRGAWFYTGSGAQNFDGRIHAVTTDLGGGRFRVGFEDLCRTGSTAGTDPLCYNTQYVSDFDFDDLTFEVQANQVVPEPGTWALLGTGLVALGGVARRRRNRA